MSDQILQLHNNLVATKADFYRNQATYDDMRDAARAYLEAVRAAEIVRFGKAKTKVTSAAISSLLR